MIFTPKSLASLWDTWLYWDGTTHYLFYLASTTRDRPWDSIGMATSVDGVHFDDLGLVIYKADDAEMLGAGHTWRADNGKYIFNFSELRNGTLEIFFAESDDLLHWTRIPSEQSISRLDPGWYAEGTEFSDQRWDNIWAIPDESGSGYFGYVTAVAKDGPVGLRGTCASVRSDDGIVFTTGAPVIEPGLWGDKLEIGGVEKIDEQYYMFASQAEIPLGMRWSAHHPQATGGVYVLRSGSQEGPFELDPRQRPVLVSAPEHYTYFSRFYRYGDTMLTCHHSLAPSRYIATIYPKVGTYLAPLKRVVVQDGVLSFGWWEGNAALAGRTIEVSLDHSSGRGLSTPAEHNASGTTFDAFAGGQLPIREHLDLHQGIVLEFTTTLQAHTGKTGGAGLLIEGDKPWSGTVLLADTEGQFLVGGFNGYQFRADDWKALPDSCDRTIRWRVLIREQFVEVYLDDAFVQAYSQPDTGAGRIAFVAESATVTVADVNVNVMDL